MGECSSIRTLFFSSQYGILYGNNGFCAKTFFKERNVQMNGLILYVKHNHFIIMKYGSKNDFNDDAIWFFFFENCNHHIIRTKLQRWPSDKNTNFELHFGAYHLLHHHNAKVHDNKAFFEVWHEKVVTSGSSIYFDGIDCRPSGFIFLSLGNVRRVVLLYLRGRP